MSALALLAILAAAPPSSPGQLVVPTVQVSGVEAAAAPVVTELVLEALLTRHGLPALGPADLKDLLSIEQQRQLIGCDEGKCMAEIAGALGGGRVVSGLIGKLGDTFVLTLKLIDTDGAQVIARASRSVARLDKVGEIVGPAVDELLGAKPRAATAVPQLVERRKAEEKTRAASDVPVFCGALLERYLAEVLGDAGPTRLLEARQALLEDLWFTPFFAELDKKLECARAREPEVLRRSDRRRLGAVSGDEADRAALGAREWAELVGALPVLVEAYKLGAEKERLGTGARPVALPFVLRVARPPARATAGSAPERYAAASQAVADALAALGRGDKAGFVAVFEKRPGRPDPRDVYVEWLGAADRARLDPCPAWVIEPGDLAARAARADEVRACLRRIDRASGEVTLQDLEATAAGGKYKLIAPAPPPEPADDGKRRRR